MPFEAAHRRLGVDELRRRAEAAWSRLAACDLCAHRCGTDRFGGTDGANSRTGARAVVGSAQPHFGEENPLVGRAGSGTIFFAWCNLRCVYCQNADLSDGGAGAEVSRDTYLNVMAQYRPYHRAAEHPAIARMPTAAEYSEAVRRAESAGLRLDRRQPRLAKWL